MSHDQEINYGSIFSIFVILLANGREESSIFFCKPAVGIIFDLSYLLPYLRLRIFVL